MILVNEVTLQEHTPLSLGADVGMAPTSSAPSPTTPSFAGISDPQTGWPSFPASSEALAVALHSLSEGIAPPLSASSSMPSKSDVNASMQSIPAPLFSEGDAPETTSIHTEISNASKMPVTPESTLSQANLEHTKGPALPENPELSKAPVAVPPPTIELRPTAPDVPQGWVPPSEVPTTPTLPESPKAPMANEASKAPVTADAPKTPVTTEVPNTPVMNGPTKPMVTPEAPVAPGMIDVPQGWVPPSEVPTTPTLPESPKVPMANDTPKTPVTADAPKASVTVEVPNASMTTDAPKTPVTTEGLNAPVMNGHSKPMATPEAPVAPGMTDVPQGWVPPSEVPTTPTLPESPKVPIANDTTKAPVTAEGPQASVTVDTPKAPMANEASKAPVTTDAPKTPVTTEVPNAPVMNGHSKPMATPEAPVAPGMTDVPQGWVPPSEVPTTPTLPESPKAPVATEGLNASVTPTQPMPAKEAAPSVTSPSLPAEVFEEEPLMEQPALKETPSPYVVLPNVAPAQSVAQPTAVETVHVASDVSAHITETMRVAAEAVAETFRVSPELATTGRGEIQIQLKRDVLEGSGVRFEVQGSELKITLTPATQAVAHLLEKHLETFQTHLAERVANWRISVGVTAWDPKPRFGRMERDE